MRRWLRRGLVGLVVLFVAIQAIPYGRAHANPPVKGEPPWDSPRTEELARRACYDCHSNETNWPWYTNIAPLSWWIENNVREGRDELNFSEWGVRRQEGGEAAETVRKGSMPPIEYTWLHPAARLGDEELQALERGLAATFGSEHEGGEGGEDD